MRKQDKLRHETDFLHLVCKGMNVRILMFMFMLLVSVQWACAGTRKGTRSSANYTVTKDGFTFELYKTTAYDYYNYLSLGPKGTDDPKNGGFNTTNPSASDYLPTKMVAVVTKCILTGNVTIPSSVVHNSETYQVISLGYNLFYNNSNVTKLTIPSSIRILELDALTDADKIQTLVLEDGDKPLFCYFSGDYTWRGAFTYMDGLRDVTIGRDLKCGTTDKYAPFYNNNETSSPINVTITSAVTTIPDNCFKGMKANGFRFNPSESNPASTPNLTVSEHSFQGLSCEKIFLVFGRDITVANATQSTVSPFSNITATINDLNFKGSFSTFKFSYAGSNGTTGYKDLFPASLSDLALLNLTDALLLKEIPANMFANSRIYNKVVIPSCVTTIGENAFKNCANLNDFDLSSATSLKTLGPNAISGTKITTLDISHTAIEELSYVDDLPSLVNVFTGSSLKSISDCFKNAPSLMGFNASLSTELSSITYSFNQHKWYRINLKNTQLGDEALTTMLRNSSATSELIELRLPSKATKLPDFPYENLQILDLTGAPSLTSLEGSLQNSRIKELFIPKGVQTIPSSFCTNCSLLASITFEQPSSVSVIGAEAFARTALTGFDMDWVPNVTQIPDRAFDSTPLASFTITSRITSIGMSALQNTQIQSITIPQGVTEIADGVFMGCSKLVSADLSACTNLTTLSNKLFMRCTALNDVKLPANVSAIGNNTFRATGISSVTLSDNIASVGEYAYSDCENLTTVTLGRNCRNLDTHAFYNSNLQDIYLLADISAEKMQNWNSDLNQFGASTLSNATLHLMEANTGKEDYLEQYPWRNFTHVDDNAIHTTDANGWKWKTYKEGTAYNYNIKDGFGVSNLDGAILEGGNLTGDVIIPETYNGKPVVAIKRAAFSDNNEVTSVTLPASLRMIESNAFKNCNATIISGYTPNLVGIGNSAFEGTNTNLCFWMDTENPEESRLQCIGDRAFNGTPLRKLYLPATTMSIGSYQGTYTDIYYFGNTDVAFTGQPWGNGADETSAYNVKLHLNCTIERGGDTHFGFPHLNANKKYTTLFDIHDILKSEHLVNGMYEAVCTRATCGEVVGCYINEWDGEGDLLILGNATDGYTYDDDLTIDDSKPLRTPVPFTVNGSIDYNRTVTSGSLITVILPFAVNASEINGKLYKMTDFTDDNIRIEEANEEVVPANTPFLVKVGQSTRLLTDAISGRAVSATVNSDLTPLTFTTTTASVGLVGSMVQQTMTDEGLEYYANNSSILERQAIANVAPFRALFTLASGSSSEGNITLFSGFMLRDGVAYTDAVGQTNANFTYVRSFSNTYWQSLFVPFDIEMTAGNLELFDIAKPYFVATTGASEGGMVDKGDLNVVVLKKLKENDVAHHGTPYFIRPKSAGSLSLMMDDATIYACTETTTLSCSTADDDYEFVGIYQSQKIDEPLWYAMAGGSLRMGDAASPAIGAQRWYMTKTSKVGYSAPSSAPARVKAIRVATWDEDYGEATGVISVEYDNDILRCDDDNRIYNINGSRMNADIDALPKGIYIRGGKKFIKK